MKILLDNGHGIETQGKRSPDGLFREYKWTRDIARRIKEELNKIGYDAELIVKEETDISLGERCKRVNAVCNRCGASNTLLVSIHNNAASNYGWQNARGWTVWVYTKASDKSKQLAKLLYQQAEKEGLKGNRYVPECRYWEANYYILKNTNCPAVLTENLFQDNKDDVKCLLSKEGQDTIVRLHVNGIINYIKSQSK